MQVPKRRAQLLKIHEPEAVTYLTQDGIRRLQDTIEDLEKRQKPLIIEDLSAALAKGDLSENAEYSDAKARLGRIEGRIFSLKQRLKNVVEIQHGASHDGRVQIGSLVTVLVNGKERKYTIVGTQETQPAAGRISHQSPLGRALLDTKIGDKVSVEAPEQTIEYIILGVD
ncbi:transcription elongation factor GreA [Candidatus Uhrbacteria bacterium]|nr:transcription elongation factor GreA [Candidatus Uhrbacteria bacterium]